MSEIRKITDGYVIQRWDKNTGKFLGQEFIAGTNPEYEDEQGNNIDEIEPEYVPYEMEQFIDDPDAKWSV